MQKKKKEPRMQSVSPRQETGFQEAESRGGVFLDRYQVNLSDFALLLSVMKVKEAYEDVLSIILNDMRKQNGRPPCRERWLSVLFRIKGFT